MNAEECIKEWEENHPGEKLDPKSFDAGWSYGLIAAGGVVAEYPYLEHMTMRKIVTQIFKKAGILK